MVSSKEATLQGGGTGKIAIWKTIFLVGSWVDGQTDGWMDRNLIKVATPLPRGTQKWPSKLFMFASIFFVATSTYKIIQSDIGLDLKYDVI